MKCEGYGIPQDKILNFYEYFEILSSNEFIIKFPSDSNYFINENSSKKNLVTPENIWKKDKLSPQIEIINYEKPISFCFFHSFLIWPLKSCEVLMRCLLDESFIYSNNECSHFHHVFPISEKSSENCENDDLLIEDIYCLNSAPIRKVSKTNQNVSYPLQLIINFSSNIAKFNKIMKKSSSVIHNKSDLNKKKAFVEYYSENNEFGNFIAFEDYMVKCCFHDRTLVSIDSNEEFISILSKKGEQIVETMNNLKKNEFAWYLNEILYHLIIFFKGILAWLWNSRKKLFYLKKKKNLLLN